VGRPGFAAAPGQSAATPEAALRYSTGQARTDPPPFAFGYPLPGALLAPDLAPDSTPTTAPPPGPPFRVALITGDDVEQAGFTAYLNRLNRAGGAGGRRFQLVGADQHPDAIVNLSGTPLAQQPEQPALDALLAPESSLHDTVFGFAGVPERQGHLIAAAVYPQPVTASSTAVVYQEPSGVLGREVPAAIAAVLNKQGVTVVPVTVEPGRPIVPVPADAAFLSLTADDAKAVIAAYPQAPAKGFNGIVTLADPSVAAALPAGVRLISPYAFPDNAESAALAHDTGKPLSARLVHGWVAAKTLAVAVWRDDPRTPAALRAALERMAGYSNGFAPAYEFHAGTHSVAPEGVLFTTDGRGLVQQGDFRTDRD
jgi:nucleotide-binding universal stress UspA family protein